MKLTPRKGNHPMGTSGREPELYLGKRWRLRVDGLEGESSGGPVMEAPHFCELDLQELHQVLTEVRETSPPATGSRKEKESL